MYVNRDAVFDFQKIKYCFVALGGMTSAILIHKTTKNTNVVCITVISQKQKNICYGKLLW